MASLEPQDPNDDRPGPPDPAGDDGQDAPIDLERLVWDLEYRREIARRLGRAAPALLETSSSDP